MNLRRYINIKRILEMKHLIPLCLILLAFFACNLEESEKTEDMEKVEANAEKPTYITYTWYGELAPYPSPEAVVKQFLKVYDASFYES